MSVTHRLTAPLAAIVLTACVSVAIRPTTGPDQMTRMFYDQWVNYEGDPMADGLYVSSEYITTDFARRLQEAAEDNDPIDPVLCEITDPVLYDVLAPSIDSRDRTAHITVDEHYPDGTQSIVVSLMIVGNDWRIDNVLCP